MSHEAVPETRRQNSQTGRAEPAGRAAHDGTPARAGAQDGQEPAAPAQAGGAPKGLLQQMEELMAALNADLSQLDAELQSSTDRTPPNATPSPGSSTPQGGATQGGAVPGGASQGGTTQGGASQDGDGPSYRSA
ncbi:hypothetical protein GCM10010347_46350 [Streptomyces cirratus]|uniref:Uncharacterized protein n=1 Tax=Streptomyces cirratus TaxID=68187 RepID=A0ABQ3EX77_9ACTN|nr:hypothetical protein [Streptomyces cirratus]GHB70899.1 hypothetical protein GCM10010347_46350 [Streptomyces cirratus]